MYLLLGHPVHEEAECSCKQCDYKSTSKGNLDTKGRYMKESNVPVGYTIFKQGQRAILLNIKAQYIKMTSKFANIASIKKCENQILKT